MRSYFSNGHCIVSFLFQNINLVILGIISTIVAFVGSALVLKTFAADVKLLSLHKNSFTDYRQLRIDQ